MLRARFLLAFLIAPILGLGLAVAAPRPAVDDDDDDRAARAEEARVIFTNNCQMCHGADMTSNHRLTAKQWTTEVEKMIGWGAPVPPEQKQPLIDWLAATYPATSPAPAPATLAPAEAVALDLPAPTPLPAPGSADPVRGASLFAQHCASCHGPTAKGGEIGVNLVEKPALLHADGFHALLHDGRRRMPAFAPVLDRPAQDDVLAWLRTQR